MFDAKAPESLISCFADSQASGNGRTSGRNSDAIYKNSNSAEFPDKLLAQRQILRFWKRGRDEIYKNCNFYFLITEYLSDSPFNIGTSWQDTLLPGKARAILFSN